MFDCSGAYEDSETNIYLFIIFTKESSKHIEYEKAFFTKRLLAKA